MGHRRETVSLVPHRNDNGAVIAGPTHKRDAENQPDQSRKPTPQAPGHDSAHDRPCRGDRLEVVAEQDVAVRRHEVYTIHIENGWGGALRIRLNDIAVD